MSSRAAKSGQLSRRERKKIETRQKILDAALKLMTARSYDEVKVDDICEEADIALATFFAYFPTKSALITAFNERVFAKLSAQLQSYDVPAPEKLELLRALMITEWEAQSDLMRSLVREADSGARGGPGSMAVDENLSLFLRPTHAATMHNFRDGLIVLKNSLSLAF